MKKIIIIAIIGYLFFAGVKYLDNFMNEEFFDAYYTRDYAVEDNQDDQNFIDKTVKFVTGLFKSNKKQEKYIYK